MKRSNNNIDKEIYQSPTVKESIKLAMSETPAEEFQLELMQTLSQFDKWKEANPDKSYDDFLREVGLDRVELSSELSKILKNLDTDGVPFSKGGRV